MVELKIPQSGESITEVQIGAWLKAAGDYVHADEVVAEIETDKASMELPAPVSGTITKLLKQVGELVAVGEPICLIDETAAKPAEAPATATVAESSARTAEPRVMPAARRALAERGLRATDVTPTGPGGRVLKEDAQRSAASMPGAGSAATSSPKPAPPAPPPSPAARDEEAVPMTMIRRRIAERLVQSQNTAALLTTFNEVDMSGVTALRTERGEAFERNYGIKLGLMSFFVKAAIDALKLFPAVNAEIRELPAPDGRLVPHIVYKNHYDIGVAVSTEQGLVVPVIRNADRLSFAEVEQAITDLAGRARARRLSVEELQGGTFTISNGGVFGSLMSTPIVNPPQSAILGLHAIQERPVARAGQIVIRPMMYVALTYDHRIIDGRESVTFLRRIRDCIEDPARMLLEI